MGGHHSPLIIFIVGILIISTTAKNPLRKTRSIELSAANALIADVKLTTDIHPLNYTLDIRTNIEESKFSGVVNIHVKCIRETKLIVLHAHYDLEIIESSINVTKLNEDNLEVPSKKLAIRRLGRIQKKSLLEIYLNDPMLADMEYNIEIAFNGNLWDIPEGLFKGLYLNENGEKNIYLATHMRPNSARKLFPCFDEPGIKTSFNVTISRPRSYTTLFNTAVANTTDIEGNQNYVVDHFYATPPMATFSFGFIISKLVQVNKNSNPEENKKPEIKIWSRPDLQNDLVDLEAKIRLILNTLTSYFKIEYPICKLDIVALPGLTSVKPIDNWSLIIFKESDLSNRGYYTLAQELVYQWIGSWITPNWWSDAHINKAIAGYLAASTAIEIDNGQEFDGKWPMTILYSIYYEFSKRYPHSRITGMKQETTCSKTELVLRMLNFTLGSDTFKKGLQKFFKDRTDGTFFTEDVWKALTEQAHEDKTLSAKYFVNAIAESWITKDRIPVVIVKRDYTTHKAIITQRVYLRERPHDVPEQEKMLWWIPLVIVTQNKLDFTNSTPYIWMEKNRDVTIENLVDNQFVIVNPEEIGPFPVNYDTYNWNLLANYLQTSEGRTRIPVYTRAKLLHDAWNLAYAGDLSFATAFNMTLFMKYEREHLVWNPVFTLIDHIGRHIDMSAVHKKFETYVRILLTPLYEELGPQPVENEENWKDNLRSLARTFLCRAGYRPCIEEAQSVYKKWMDSPEPDEGNPVPNQYICPVFKWGTQEEWEFGLQRVINFPASRKQNERTYLLKTLAGCPKQSAKIERLLTITILEENGNFTENDIFLIFSMLSGGSSGYTTLFNFLADNWDIIREKFEHKTNLWDNLIGSATGVFTTQEGYDMVSELYVQRQGEFGSAEHIIEKSLKNIKEETRWSDENLPIIEQWLDDYLKTVNTTDNKFMG